MQASSFLNGNEQNTITSLRVQFENLAKRMKQCDELILETEDKLNFEIEELNKNNQRHHAIPIGIT